MDRQDAFRLADEVLVATGPEAALLLRPVLTDTFQMIDDPEAHLISRAREELTVFLLCPPRLFIATVQGDPPTVDLQSLNLSEAAIARQCEDVRSDMGGVWWQTRWRVVHGPVSAQFVGQEGPQSVDQGERFARQVATIAGWPISPPD
jgi:hypothetical protein